MGRSFKTWLASLALLLVSASCYAQQTWTEGKNYFLITPPQRTNVAPGKVEVMEVFSYACPACNAFHPIMDKLAKSLPPNAQVVYLPASFIPAEDWPAFQRAYFAADALGVAAKTHDAMFDAVWTTGELAVSDPTTHRLKSPLPSIEDIAKFYSRTAGVPVAKFLGMAKSFSVDAKMKQADTQIYAMQALSTPMLIVNGKYRLDISSAGGYDQLVQLVKYLVAQESGGATKVRAAKVTAPSKTAK
jgi:protein dithiol oxidoreductase (disulfide-forming)